MDSKPMDQYEERYGKTLTGLVSATAEVVAAGDARGLHFLIECCDAILGRGVLLLEAKQNQAEGKVN